MSNIFEFWIFVENYQNNNLYFLINKIFIRVLEHINSKKKETVLHK